MGRVAVPEVPGLVASVASVVWVEADTRGHSTVAADIADTVAADSMAGMSVAYMVGIGAAYRVDSTGDTVEARTEDTAVVAD